MKSRQLLLAVVIAGVVALPVAALTKGNTLMQLASRAANLLTNEGGIPSLAGATGWLNSPPLTAEGLRGKVVLFDVWTLTCINWLRTEPYVRAWAEKYKDQGLVVIGLHAPEFDFERNANNVRRAVQAMDITYPIALDNDFAIWRGLDNNYWPALYLVDAEGHVRYHQFGEGGYEEAERAIQRLLAEAGLGKDAQALVSVVGQGVEAPADWMNLRSPESYLGYGRSENFASPGGVAPDRRKRYTLPVKLGRDHWGLDGDWSITQEAVQLNDAKGQIAFRFHARDLHLVLARPAEVEPIRFRITIDGAPPGADHGVDTDAEGWGLLDASRLYQLVRQSGPITDRTFEIELFGAGVRAYDFTFG